ncbi:MAG: tetratricopeptide repeat protein [Candidatus Omnitrophica bacterium]|nr:tetratricopeptide repeat protein [Candidatus Omnitrophota bacterium]
MITFKKIHKQYALVFLLICAASFLAYFNSLTNPFIWDDNALVAGNKLIRSWQNSGLTFVNHLYPEANSGSNFYRPLQSISYIFDYHFWQLDPFGYHLTNIILQIGVSFLVFLLLFNLLANLPIAVAASVFFAVSPLNTEVVTYISGRADMLMGFFLILSLLLFIRSQKGGVKKPVLLYALSIGSFVLALFSKEAAIFFPFIICGYIFYFLHEKIKERHYFIKQIIPFFTASLIYLGIRFFLFDFAAFYEPSLAKVFWFIRLSVLPKIIFIYLKLLIFPIGLHMSRQFTWQGSQAQVLFGLSCLGLMIAGCLYLLRYSSKNKAASFMFFWALVFFIPQSGIFPINTFIAEHFIYLSSISFYLLVVYILYKALSRRMFIPAVGLLCVFYILLTAGRNFEWGNQIVFYKNIIKYSPQSYQAHNNLGLQYELRMQNEQAIEEYKKALEIKPDLLEARSNLANLYLKLKHFTQAKREYEFAKKICPPDKVAEIENNIANAYEAEGSFEQAIKRYKLALKLDPGIVFAHYNLARIYYAQGDTYSAGLHILESLKEVTGSAKAADCRVIAGFLKSCGYVGSAEEFYNNLGVRFARNGRWEAAASAYRRALELNPDFPGYYYNLGVVYLNMGNRLEAKRALRQALKINPNYIRAKRLIIEDKL